jgi:uncharacterized membrane protein YkoI
MKTKVIIASLAAIVMVAAGCASEQQQQAEMQSQAKVTKEQAQELALTKAPGGTVKEGELENENGLLIWSFDIATPGTKNTTEVNIDAVTGKIVSVSTETPESEAKEKD